jgi:hypothetical protein
MKKLLLAGIAALFLATGAAAEVDNAQLTSRLAQLLFQRNEVLVCGDWRISGSSDGKLQGGYAQRRISI